MHVDFHELFLDLDNQISSIKSVEILNQVPEIMLGKASPFVDGLTNSVTKVQLRPFECFMIKETLWPFS